MKFLSALIFSAALAVGANAVQAAPSSAVNGVAANGGAGLVTQVADLDVYVGRPYGHRRWHRRGPRYGVYVDGPRRGYRRCRNWRHECADRFGWRSWRFDRCMRRHGC